MKWFYGPSSAIKTSIVQFTKDHLLERTSGVCKVIDFYATLLKLFSILYLYIRVGGSYEYSLVAANIMLCTLFYPESAKKGFKKSGNQLGLGLEDLLL